MNIVLAFALIGALLGFLPIPGTSIVLIALEVFLIYKIQCKYNAFDLGSFLGVSTGLVAVSAILKALAAVLIVIPGIGWLMSSLIAFGFIMVFGTIAEGHYSKLTHRSH